MKGNRSLFTVVGVVAVLIAGMVAVRAGRQRTRRRLLDRFEAAEKRPRMPGLFAVEDVTLAGETKKAITITPTVGTASPSRCACPTTGG